MRLSPSSRLLIGCAALSCGGRQAPNGGAGDAQAPRLSLDGECDLDNPFVLRGPVAGLDEPAIQGASHADQVPVLTADELTVVFDRTFSGAQPTTKGGLFIARRRTRDEAFADVRRVLPEGQEFSGPFGRTSLSNDGLRLLFFVRASRELRLARRASLDADFVVDPTRFVGFGPADGVVSFVASGDQQTIYVDLTSAAGVGVFRRTWTGEQWENEELVLNADVFVAATNTDGSTLAFSNRANRIGMSEGIWFVERGRQGAFGTPVHHPEFGVPQSVKGGPDMTEPSWISPNGCRVYYGNYDDGHGRVGFAQRGK